MPVSSGERCSAARSTIRGRTSATASGAWGDRFSALSRPLDDLQDFRFRGSETFVGVLKQFLRNSEIDQRGMNIAVTEICREIRQPGLRVDPLFVPLRHPMDDEGVAQIVDTRPGTAGGAL